MRASRLVSTSLALGAALALSVGASVAEAAPAVPTPVKTTPSGPVSARGITVPPFPGLNASDAQMEAWAQAVAKNYHLPTPPSDLASDAQKMAYVQRVLSALGAPSADASEAQWSAWFAKMAKSLGLPNPPSASAGEDAWVEWLQNALGIDIGELLDGMGADAILSDAYCTRSGGRVAVSAINLGSTPAKLRPFLDRHALRATISLAGTSKTATAPVTYEGTIAVPNGRHLVSIVDTTTGETLDSMTTHLACRVNAKISSGQLPKTKTPAQVNSAKASAAPAAGPVVETDHVASGSSGLDFRESAAAAALALGAATAGMRRFARRR